MIGYVGFQFETTISVIRCGSFTLAASTMCDIVKCYHFDISLESICQSHKFLTLLFIVQPQVGTCIAQSSVTQMIANGICDLEKTDLSIVQVHEVATARIDSILPKVYGKEMLTVVLPMYRIFSARRYFVHYLKKCAVSMEFLYR